MDSDIEYISKEKMYEDWLGRKLTKKEKKKWLK